MITHADTAREARGREIAKSQNSIYQIEETIYRVRSQSGSGYYDVEQTEFGWRCNCPDHQKHGVSCKHILAVNYLLKLQNETSQNMVIEKIRVTYTQVWKVYNAAQKAELNLFDKLLNELLSVIPEPAQTIGRRRISLHDSLYGSILKVYSQLSSRRAYSLYQNAVERGYIKRVPHFNFSSRFFNKSETTPILSELVFLSALPVARIETNFIIDSTGFRTTTFSLFNSVKYSQIKKHQWLKAHLCTGVNTNIITAIEVTDENGGDSPQFSPLIKRTSEGFTINEVSADMAYSSRKNIDLVASLGGTPYILFKQNAIVHAKDSAMWKKMYYCYHHNREEFLKHYHKRSNIESTNAAIKIKLGETLKSKNRVAQENELLAKVIAYNLTVLIHEMYENGINLDFSDVMLKYKKIVKPFT